MLKFKNRSVRLDRKTLWVVTAVLFLLLSALGVWLGIAHSTKSDTPADSGISLDTDSVSVDTDPYVTTKAPNTGDPYMTTVVISDTVYTNTETDTETETETDVEITYQDSDTDTVTDTQTLTTGRDTDKPDDTSPVYPEDSWCKMLVNPWNPISQDYTPELVTVSDGHRADYRVKDALEAMLADCRKAGYNPIICSSYRTYSYQKGLFDRQVALYLEYGYSQSDAEAEAARWVARPGTSEHHTGLAFDIVAASYQTLDHTQANTPEQKWLMANCHKYGFILRYPENKTDITGINYEPWHYRYVGVDVAAEITQSGICFEEYLDNN